MALRPDDIEDFGSYPFLHPIQKTALVEEAPDTGMVRRYHRFFRSMDGVLLQTFYGMQVIDDNGVPFQVPIIVGTIEKAVAAVFGNNMNFDQHEGQPVRVRLPIIALVPGDDIDIDTERYIYHEALNWNKFQSERYANDVVFGETAGLPINRSYTLVIMTRYMEDHVEIMEQVLAKFVPFIEVRIQDTFFNSEVHFNGASSNINDRPPEDQLKIYRTEVSMLAKGWMPQSVRREKTVLKTRIETGIGDPNALVGSRDSFIKSASLLSATRPTDDPLDQDDVSEIV